jgi:2'-5' RNA ligase
MADQEHTGGMVALVPADPQQLVVVDGGEPADELHLTLAYLGDDVTAWTPDQTQAVLDAAAKIAADVGAPIEARAMGHTTFNPDGGDDGSREPCAVYTIGDSAQIMPLHTDVVQALTAALPDLHPQHTPFLPHITAGYQMDASALTYAGPVTFDRLRVALAGDVTDYPLGTSETSKEDTVTAAATTEAPEITGPPVDGEIPLRFPVLVLEGFETSDGRFLEAGSLTHRALPIPLLALPESAHGGDEPGPAGVVGRIDTLTRTPGPDVISPRTGEPFPEGTFVWSGTGAMSATARVGEYDVADMFRRRFLRGVSVDLAGMDYDIIGGEDGLAADPEFPRRRMVAHSADIAAATLVCIAAFGDAYAEDATEPATTEPANLEDIPEGLAASAFPAWRSAETGDYPALTAAGAEPAPLVEVTLPVDAVDQLAAEIDTGDGEQRDAHTLAAALVEFMTGKWQESPAEEKAEDAAEPPAPGMAAAPPPAAAQTPDKPHPFAPDPKSPESCAVCGAPKDDPIHTVPAPGKAANLEEAAMAAADTPAPPPVDDPADPAMETGAPDEAQPCAVCGDPATHSLLFDGPDGASYVPCCDTDDEAARQAITAEGFDITGEIPIDPNVEADPSPAP